MKTLYRFLWPDGPYVGRASFVLGADEDDAYRQLTDAGAQEGASIVGGELSPVDRFMLSFCPNDIVDEDLCWEGVTWLQDEPSGDTFQEGGALAPSLARARFDADVHWSDPRMEYVETDEGEEDAREVARLLDCPKGAVDGDLSEPEQLVRSWIKRLFDSEGFLDGSRRVALSLYPQGLVIRTSVVLETDAPDAVADKLLKDAVDHMRAEHAGTARRTGCIVHGYYELNGPTDRDPDPLVFELTLSPEVVREATGSIH